MTKYFSFNGEATRSEFWGVTVMLIVLGFTLGVLGGAAILASDSFILISLAAIVAVIITATWVTAAVTVRRCRNADLNPWWTAATFVPYIGFIPFIVIGCLRSKNAE